MEEIEIFGKEKSGASLSKAEGNKEEIVTLTQQDCNKLDSIYTRVVNASDDLKTLVKELSQERGSLATWYTLGNAQEEMDRSLKGIENILYGEVL